MELLSETSTCLILIEKEISIKSFHQKSQDFYFISLELRYSKYKLKFKFTISANIYNLKNFHIEESPFLLKRYENNFSLIFQMKKQDLINSSKSEVKIVKSKVCHNDVLLKALIYIPAPHKRSMTREEWLLRHPLQGGNWSPK